MKLTDDQWKFVRKRIPVEVGGGRPRRDARRVLDGIFWILKTGARWRDLPKEFPSYQTCHRRFQEWRKAGVIRDVLEDLVRHLQKKGRVDLTETYIDASFVEAKKGDQKSGRPSAGKALKSWQSLTIRVFQSPYPLQVLHRMRVRSLKERFGPAIQKTFLSDLSETKLTILMSLGKNLGDDFDASSLLPISAIGENHQLKMAELLDATDEDGWSNDSFPGFNPFGA